MPIPSAPTQVIFPAMRGAGLIGRFRIRISRNSQKHNWLEDHPEDTLVLDPNKIPFLKSDFGKITYKSANKNGGLVPQSWNFGLRDSYIASGTINGVATGDLDFSTINTSFLPWFFNDKSVLYDVWIDRLNPDDTLKEICYNGVLDYNDTESHPYSITAPMTSLESKLSIKNFKTSTAYARAKKLFVDDLLGIITQADMGTTGRTQFYGGYVLPSDWHANVDVPRNGITDLLGPDGTVSIDWSMPGQDLRQVNEHLEIANYPFDREGETKGMFDNGEFVNVHGVKFGWQAISLGTILSKCATLIGISYSSGNVDNNFIRFRPRLINPGDTASPHHGYSTEPLGYGIDYDHVYICYNTAFGVRPDLYKADLVGIISPAVLLKVNDPHGYSELRTVVGVDNSHTSYVEYTTSVDHGIADGQFVLCTSSDSAVNNDSGIATVTSPTTFQLPKPGHGVSVTATDAVWYLGKNYIDSLNTPVTFPRDMSLADLLREFCNQDNLEMTWDVEQSGANIGRPIIYFKDILTSDADIPAAWAEHSDQFMLDGSSTGITEIAKQCVKLSYVGDDAALYAPRLPRVGDEVIERKIRWRKKKWGKFDGLDYTDLINNSNKDAFSQKSSFYGIITNPHPPLHQVDFTDDGWWLGSCEFDYYGGGMKPVPYPPDIGWTADRLPGATTSDDSGFVALMAETYLQDPNWNDFDNIDFRNCDSRYAKIKHLATALLHGNEVTTRRFSGAVDDAGNVRTLFRRLRATWRDEDGNVTEKKTSEMSIDLINDIAVVGFVQLFTGADVQAMTVVDSTGGSLGSSSIGGGNTGSGAGTGGTGGKEGAFVAKVPSTNLGNVIMPAPNVDTALGIGGGLALMWAPNINVGASTTLNNIAVVDSNGVSYSVVRFVAATNPCNLTGFVAPSSPLVLHIQNGTSQILTLKTENTGSVAANRIVITNYHGWAAEIQPGGFATIRYNVTDARWQMEAIYPYAADTVDTSVGLSLSDLGNGAQRLTLSAGGVPLDRLASEADSTVLANISGSVSSPIAVTLSAFAAALSSFYDFIRKTTNGATTNTITSTSISHINLILKRYAAQVANLLEFRTNTGAVMSYFNPSGSLTINNSTNLSELDVTGKMNLRVTKYDIPAGTYDSVTINWSGTEVILVQTGTSGDVVIVGMGGGVDGALVRFRNNMIGTLNFLQFNHRDAAEGTAANRFDCAAQVNQSIPPGGAIEFRYSTDNSYWEQVGTNGAGFFALIPVASQTVQSASTGCTTFFKANGSDVLGEMLMQWFSPSNGPVVSLQNNGVIHTLGSITVGNGSTAFGHTASPVKVVDIAAFLTAFDILDLDIGDAQNVKLADSTGNVGTTYNLKGIKNGVNGRPLVIVLDSVFGVNGNSVQTFPLAAAELNTNNQIDSFFIGVSSQYAEFLYDASLDSISGVALNKWKLLDAR